MAISPQRGSLCSSSSSTSTMTPRSPPARPHIGINVSHRFSATEWGEDDAWDSASDSESPRQSSLTSSWNHSTSSSSTSAPKIVPRSSNNSSSSTLAFSYTHLNAPNPSSYPPNTDPIPSQTPKNGWTIVRKGPNTLGDQKHTDGGTEREKDDLAGDVDVEGDMILGDLETESNAPGVASSESSLPSQLKGKENRRHIREDVDNIVNGSFIHVLHYLS